MRRCSTDPVPIVWRCRFGTHRTDWWPAMENIRCNQILFTTGHARQTRDLVSRPHLFKEQPQVRLDFYMDGVFAKQHESVWREQGFHEDDYGEGGSPKKREALTCRPVPQEWGRNNSREDLPQWNLGLDLYKKQYSKSIIIIVTEHNQSITGWVEPQTLVSWKWLRPYPRCTWHGGDQNTWHRVSGRKEHEY